MSVNNLTSKNISDEVIKSLENVMCESEYIFDGNEIYIDDFEFEYMSFNMKTREDYLIELETSFVNINRFIIDEFDLKQNEETFKSYIRTLSIHKYVYKNKVYFGHRMIPNKLY